MTAYLTSSTTLCHPDDAAQPSAAGPCAHALLELEGVTVAARCAYYEQVCQLPTVPDPVSGQIVLIAGRVQAVMVPSALGRRVRSELGRVEVGCGPIVSHPKSGTWTFLTDSDRRIEALPDATRLWVNGVVVLASGARIGLPTPTATNTGSCRAWESPPTSPQRPTTTTVLDAVRRFLQQGGAR